MWSRACIAALRSGLLVAWCLLANMSSWAADPGASGPWDSLVLRGGRVLHNAKVMSDEGDSLVIRCDEGLLKVAKSSLPQAAGANPSAAPSSAAPEMVMQPFDPDAAPPSEPDPQAKPKIKPKPAPERASAAKAAQGPVFKGCTIASFTMKPFQNSLGAAQVVVENGTDAPVVIIAGNFVCVTADGKRLAGRQIVMDGFPPIIKRRQVVPPRGNVDVQVTFSNDAVDASSVQWAQ
jgi:hypothetical protein